MKFGFDKYVEIEGPIGKYPLPNALVKADQVPHTLSELRKYNVYGMLFKQDLDYRGFYFEHNTVDNLVEQNEHFVYPILIQNPRIFKEISDETIYKFNNKIIDTVKRGKAKIVLSYSFEGDFYKQEDIEAVNQFVEKYKLKKGDVIVLTNNLKYKYIEPIKSNFTTIPFNYFLVNPWFTKEDFLTDTVNPQFAIRLRENLEYLSTYKKPKKFLSLNRRPRIHRIALFTELMKDSKLRENSIVSLGSRNLEFAGQSGYGNTWAEWYEAFISEDYKHGKNSGIDFLKNYDSSQDSFVDSNLEYNLAFNFNETLHLNTFVNVLTETLWENETIFLSEKIFKPILGCQPFIILGNPGTIRELKKMGFKTFEGFWDESYDDELNFSKRLEKIISILKGLVEKTDEELLEITRQMLPILQHNYEHIRLAAREEIWQLKTTLDEQFKN